MTADKTKAKAYSLAIETFDLAQEAYLRLQAAPECPEAKAAYDRASAVHHEAREAYREFQDDKAIRQVLERATARLGLVLMK